MPETKRELKLQLKQAKSLILGLFVVSILLMIAVTLIRWLNPPKLETSDADHPVNTQQPQI